MNRTVSLLIALLTALMIVPPAAPAHTREEVRIACGSLEAGAAGSPYAQAPVLNAPYEAGELTEAARREALDFLNFARWLAGLEPVSDSGIYDYQCQHGAVLLAALDYVDHAAPRPDDMDRNFYDSAHNATASGCIARFNWMRAGILREGVEYFLRDDGDENLINLGHRRWALNPTMSATGFGLANSKSGMSYVLMYAHDLGNPDAGWDSVRWPAAGAFPAELMHDHLAWSVALNPRSYDLSAAEDIEIVLEEQTGGLRFRFYPGLGQGDGFCTLNTEGYGAGPCLIFRPDFSGTGFTDYQQNQRWTVRIDGLTGRDGSQRPLRYAVDMISMYAQDVANVEVFPLEAALRPGEALQLRADVIPAYADDLSVRWRSADESVAIVDANGRVLAVGPGSCEIAAVASNGREDACRVTVE